MESGQIIKQFNEGCGLQSGMIYELDQIYKTGYEAMCKDACPCNVDSGIFSTDVAATMVTDSLGATRFDQCPYDPAVINIVQKQKYAPILEILERDFECAGFCTDGTYYIFSDVRSGPPVNGNCKHEIIQTVRDNSTLFGVIFCIIGLVGLVGLCMSAVICNLQRKRFKGQQFYDYSKWGVSKEA